MIQRIWSREKDRKSRDKDDDEDYAANEKSHFFPLYHQTTFTIYIDPHQMFHCIFFAVAAAGSFKHV